MTIQIPEDLARELESLAASQRKTAEQVVLEGLRFILHQASSPDMILRTIRRLTHPSAEAVDDLEDAISAAHLPVRERGTFDQRSQV